METTTKKKTKKNLVDIYEKYYKYGLRIKEYGGISFINFKVSVPNKSEIIMNNKPYCGKRLARHFENAIIKNDLIADSQVFVNCELRDETWDMNKEREAERDIEANLLEV